MKTKFLILSFILSFYMSFGQTEAKKLKITENDISTTAPFVNVQEANGTVNKIYKKDLQDIISVASASNLPVTGVAGKFYYVQDSKKYYTFNGTTYDNTKSNKTIIVDSNITATVGNYYVVITDGVEITPPSTAAVGEGYIVYIPAVNVKLCSDCTYSNQLVYVTKLASGSWLFKPIIVDTSDKANLYSPQFTGEPSAPTATVGTNTTQIATTAFVLANSGSGGSQNLQSVLDNGNTTTSPFYNLFDAGGGISVNTGIVPITGAPFPVTGLKLINGTQIVTTGFAGSVDNGGFIVEKEGTINKLLSFSFPDKPNISYPTPDNYTLATTDDITTAIAGVSGGTTDLSGVVPYTGATTNITLGSNTITSGTSSIGASMSPQQTEAHDYSANLNKSSITSANGFSLERTKVDNPYYLTSIGLYDSGLSYMHKIANTSTDITVTLAGDTTTREIRNHNTDAVESEELYVLPSKPTGTYTLATTDDITTAIAGVSGGTAVNTAFLPKTYASTMSVAYDDANPNFYINVTGNLDLTVIGTSNGDSGLVNLYFSGTEVATLNGTTSLTVTGSGDMIPVYYIHDNTGIRWFKDEVGGSSTPDTTKEDIANKSTNVTTDATSDTKYPSVKAVKSYIDTQVATIPKGDKGDKGDTGNVTVNGVDLIDYVQKINLNELGKSSTTIVINPINVSLGVQDNYSVSGFSFIPNKPILINGYLTKFSVYLNNSQIDRTVNFLVYEKLSTNDFKIVYSTGNISAISSGTFIYNLPTAISVTSNYYVGCIVETANTLNSIGTILSGGQDIGGGGWIKSNASKTLGITEAFNVEGNYRMFEITANVVEDLLLKADKANSANGYLSLDENKKVPKKIISENDYWAGKKIIWVGTSIPADGFDINYPKLVGEELNAILVNESVGSSAMVWNGTYQLSLSATISELTATFPGYEYNSFENKIIGKNADLLVIDHIYNDTGYFQNNLGTIDSTDKSTVYGAFNYVIQAALLDNPKIKLMFVTPPNRFQDVNANGDRNIATIDTARDIIFALAKKYNAPVCDLAILSNINSYNYTMYKEDTIHPKDEDKPRLAHILAQFIKQY